MTNRSSNLLDLEERFKYSVPENYFLDENHTTKNGGLILSNLLRDRIKLGFSN